MDNRREARPGFGHEEAEMVGRHPTPALGERHDRLIPAPTTAGDARILGRLQPRNIRGKRAKGRATRRIFG